MYKVFINNYPFFFASKKDKIKENLPVFENKPFNRITDIVFSSAGAVLLFDDVEKAWQYFLKNFRFVEAAGGVVTFKDEVLLIFRNGKWDLPKGKIDKGESPEEAAIREIEEECGLKSLNIEDKITETFHVYEIKQELFLKKTHWFKVSVKEKQETVPQVEEGIEKAVWVSKKDLNQYLNNTYESIKDVLKAALGVEA
ncbi:MAG: NUDIX domain-containing protein [Bacteroidetes bacterium]|nr:MAG: NUDIX domain-containing protein [Bacteroidota bacterium]